MKKNLNIEITAFKALGNAALCERYLNGFRSVLESRGIKNVATHDGALHTNPNVYGIVVQDKDTHTLLGGARLDIASKDYQLPLETAIGPLDPKVSKLIHREPDFKTGEICRVWNVREISGFGLSRLMILSSIAEAGISLAETLQLHSLVALCAPWTVNTFRKPGFKTETSVGDKGTFAYPSKDLIATAMSLNELEGLESAETAEREKILSLRLQPKQTKLEEGKNGPLTVNYDLNLNIDCIP